MDPKARPHQKHLQGFPVAREYPAGFAPTPLPFWQPPKGVNYAAPLSRIGPEYAAAVVNWRLEKGKYVVRPGTSTVGAVTASEIMLVVALIRSTGTRALVRFRTTGFDVYNDVTGAWVAVPGIVFTGDTEDHFTCTAWADKLIFSNGKDGMYEYDPTLGMTTRIQGAPAAKHLATFNGRIIASYPTTPIRYKYRVQWCAKNNNRDWTGTGSGYEDLFGAPGGEVDEVGGCLPISDEVAIVIRDSSIWQMMTTGVADAPFRFARTAAGIGGAPSRHACREVPGGAVVITRHDVYLVDPSGPKSIGEAIRDEVLGDDADYDSMWGTFDRSKLLYKLSLGTGVVWNYSFVDGGWTSDEYPFNIRSMSYAVRAKESITIDSLSTLAASIDALPGDTIDELGEGQPVTTRGVYFAVPGGNKFVVKEDWARVQDVNAATGTNVDSTTEIRSGNLQGGNPLETTQLVDAILEAVASAGQTLTAEISYDGGTTWQAYDTAVLTGSALRQRKTFRGTRDAWNLQLRITAPDLDPVTLIGVVFRLTKGAMPV